MAGGRLRAALVAGLGIGVGLAAALLSASPELSAADCRGQAGRTPGVHPPGPDASLTSCSSARAPRPSRRRDHHRLVPALVAPQVKVGGMYRTASVMIEVDDIELLPFSSITTRTSP